MTLIEQFIISDEAEKNISSCTKQLSLVFQLICLEREEGKREKEREKERETKRRDKFRMAVTPFKSASPLNDLS